MAIAPRHVAAYGVAASEGRVEPRVADPHHGTGLVGRDRELGELLAALAEAADSAGRLVLLGGEPGIGKSRLADELANRARERDYTVLWGRGWEDAGAPPYWPWVQALRAYLRSTNDDAIRQQLGAGATDVAQMLPELRSLYPGLEPPAEAQSDSARFQLFDSTTNFLRNAAADRPILIVIDDLQAADTPSILYLQFLASQLGQMRLLVVGTYRDVALTPDHALSRAIGELTREPTTRAYLLKGLDPEAVGQFIGAATGVVPSHRAVAAVERETKGNPLFVIEAVRLLTSEGRIDDVADLPSLRIAVPAGIREVIARRIGHLGEAVGETLALGAAIGPEFSVELLRRVGDIAGRELMNQLDGAAEAGLIAPMTASTARYRFSHDLVRETLYERLSSGRRAGVHRRIGEVLEDMTGGAADEHLAELAFHYFQAAQAPEGGPDEAAALARRAMEYARRAADQASWSLAFEEAVRLRRMALAMLAATSDGDDVLHGEILLSLGDAQARAGDLEGSKASFREAADIARGTGDVSQLARAAIGYGGRLPWTRPGRDIYIIPLLQDALVLLGGTDDRLRVRLLARLASAWRSSPQHFTQSATLSQQALEIARGIDDDPSTLSYALAGRYWSTWWPENPDERRAIAEEMVAVAESSGDAERRIDAQLMLYMAYTETSQMVEARRAEEEVHRLANELRQPSQLWLGVAPRGLLALFDGDLDAAEQYVARELNWGDPITNVRDERSAGIMHLFLLRREQGRAGEAEPLVRAAVEEFPWYPMHRAALAQVLLAQGREAEARSVFQSLAADDFAALYRDNEWLLGMALTTEACTQLGDAAAAAVLYGQLMPFAGRHAIGHAEASAGAVDRYLGLLAAAQGQLDVAVRHLTDAIHLNQAMGARPLTAHSQHELAAVLRLRHGQGDPETATALDAAALDAARTLGLVALQAAIGAHVGDEGPAAPVGSPPHAGRLAREGEYWTIAFAGETIRVRDSKGLHHLARLLAEPGREFHAVELAMAGAQADGRQAMQPRELGSTDTGDLGARLDPEAKAEYRRRLDELAEEVREAEEWHDSERAARAQAEVEFLTAELAGAVGLGGRDRKSGSTTERARLSVTRAIRSAMARIADQSPSLGSHLEMTIRTGTFCSYQPDPRVSTAWEL